MTNFAFRGAIVRIRMCNFMTYNDTELRPGPNLNMILGPNGTGKSAVVCCIIVGLAGEVSLTGRGASPADFVKKNTQSGQTEIELFNDRGPNYIVERKIIITGRTKFKIDHKSEWKINGKSCLKSEVQALTKKLNIKVDNLCQFLPQDSVTQFVKMNTSELLTNTLKAAGDNQLVDDHQTLLSQTSDIDEKRIALESLKNSCRENEANAKRLESEVTQLRQREQLIKQKSICTQKIQYAKYLEYKQNRDECQKKRDNMNNELDRIEGQSEPFRRAVEFHKSEEIRLRTSVDKSAREIRTSLDLIQENYNHIESRKIDCQEEFAKFKGKQEEENKREGSIILKQQELESYECKLNESREVDCSRNISAVEAEIEQIKAERMSCQNEKSKNQTELSTLVSSIENVRSERDQIMAVKNKKIGLLRSKYPDAARVVEWLAMNRDKFSKDIFLPIMCEINVRDPINNNIIEHAIRHQDLTAFVCQTPEDLRTFTRLIREKVRCKFNVILAPNKTTAEFEREASRMPDLSEFGVKHYLKDLVDAPEPIMRYLCAQHGFHAIPVVAKITEHQMKSLLTKCHKFYSDNQCYTVSRSRYDNKSMTVTEPIRPAQLVYYSLDTKRLSDCDVKLKKLVDSRDNLKLQRDSILAKEDKLKATWQGKAEQLQDLRAKHDQKRRLETLIHRMRELITKLKDDKIDIEAERQKLQQSIEKINKKIVDNIESVSKICKNFIALKQNHMKSLLLLEMASANHKMAQRKFQAAQRDTSRLKDEIERIAGELRILKRALDEQQRVTEEKIPGFTNGKLNKATKDKFATIKEQTHDELVVKREELTVKIQSIFKDSSNTILNEFNRQNEELKDKRERIAELESAVAKLIAERDAIKTKWVPEVTAVIDCINTNYKEFMQKLCYDGQVKLDFKADEPDNFAAYGIAIMVKYRDEEQLIPLSSTRQSGGERSVATMIYMLALQTKTSVPFRCVDEINQGMDKDNERKVFELLVKTADTSESQYFLVSPKLLANLPYSEKMKIHIVFNGKDLKLKWNEIL